MVDGVVEVQVKAGTSDFDKKLARSKKEAERFDKEATAAAAASLKLAQATAEAAKGAAKLKTDAAASAKGTAALRKEATTASKAATALKKQASEAAKAAKQLNKDTKGASSGAKALETSAAAAAKRTEVLRKAARDAAAEVKALRKAAEDSAKGTAAMKAKATEAAKATALLKKRSTEASKAARDMGKRSREAAGRVKKLETATAKANPKISKFQKAMKNSADSAALLTGPLGGIASRLSILGRITSVTGASILALSLAVGGLTLGLGAAISEAEKFERSGLRIQAVLEATGSSAGFTSQEIRSMSEGIARSTLAGTASVEAAAAKLLTFRSIQGDTFRDALELSQDLAELGFGSVEQGALQLGKALEDPITGLGTLRRVGVSFTAVQKEQIRLFVEANQLAKAQGVILGVLAQQVGGTGVKAAMGLSGAYDSLGQNFSEFMQNVGNSGPLQVWTLAIKGMTLAVGDLNRAMFSTDANKIQELLTERNFEQEVSQVGRTDARREQAKRRVAALNEEIMALQDKAVAEGKAQSAARDSAEASRVAAVADAKLAKVLEAQAKERERITKLRQSTIRGIEQEVAILGAVSTAYSDSAMSAQELAEAEQRVTVLTRLNLDATSKQGEAVSKLIAERMRLTQVIAQQRAARETSAATTARLNALNTEIQATQILTSAIGGNADEMREARVEAKAMRIEQQMTAAALQKQGQIFEGQGQIFREQSRNIAETTVRLEDMQTAQAQAFAAEQEMNSKRLEFQETLAEGLTGAVFGAESLEDALKRMVLQLSQAIVQAQILSAIQLSMGTNAQGGGGSDGFFAGLFTAVAGQAAGGGGGNTTATELHTGGIVGSAGKARSVPSTTFIGAPRFHQGLKPDEFPAILQKGEEVVAKDQVGKNRRGDQNVTFNITTPDPNAFRASQRQISRTLKQNTAAT